MILGICQLKRKKIENIEYVNIILEYVKMFKLVLKYNTFLIGPLKKPVILYAVAMAF